jgi:hypothetical protein
MEQLRRTEEELQLWKAEIMARIPWENRLPRKKEALAPRLKREVAVRGKPRCGFLMGQFYSRRPRIKWHPAPYEVVVLLLAYAVVAAVGILEFIL